MVKNVLAMPVTCVQPHRFGKMLLRRKWHQHSCLKNSMDRSYSPWGCKESDMTEQLTLSHFDCSDKKYTCSLCLSIVTMSSWASLIAQLVKNLPTMWETWVRIPQRRERLSTPVFWPREFHGLYIPQGSKESDMKAETFTHMLKHGYCLQCFKNINTFFFITPFQRWSLIPPPLNIGYT